MQNSEFDSPARLFDPGNVPGLLNMEQQVSNLAFHSTHVRLHHDGLVDSVFITPGYFVNTSDG